MSKRAFETPEDLENKFKEYIEYCKENERLANVAGFSVFADINRETFYEYKNIHPNTFKKINDMLEDEAVNCKVLGDARVIFYMKNKCGYKDRQEIENSNTQRIQIINDLGDGDGNN